MKIRLEGLVRVYADHWALVDKHTHEVLYEEKVDIVGALEQGGWVELPGQTDVYVTQGSRTSHQRG